ncbi:hypothetical protein WEB32_02580 [Streptomyces netropsis]|uniref:Uncharacterized protein n=1 Tax=Streptomyces netropsis TaxID=55404 RepID=A0A7W7PFR5_STRNE|nr:hypothetical protein [Streptomyces netropsis]MBB4889146.1 hypothetical protein [Streptomyces netropsis]GGR07657.1 hypothetical protein GCM10010219_09740 [Streptomyces netropsis]
MIAHPTPGLVESLGEAGIFAYRDDLNAWIHALMFLRDPKNWEEASRRAKARSEELSATSDLDTWCDAVESLCDLGRREFLSVGSQPEYNGNAL